MNRMKSWKFTIRLLTVCTCSPPAHVRSGRGRMISGKNVLCFMATTRDDHPSYVLTDTTNYSSGQQSITPRVTETQVQS